MIEHEVKGILEAISEDRTTIDVAKALLEDGKERVSLVVRQEPVVRERLESGPRAHRIDTWMGVVAYVEKYHTENTVIFADARAERALVVIDERAATGVETLTFQPQVDAEFTPWADLIAVGEIAAPDLATFIRANRRTIVDPDGKELALLFSQMRTATAIRLDQGRGGKSVNGVVVETKIQGQKKSELVDIPETVKVRCPIFFDEEPVDLEVDLDAYTQGQPGMTQILVRVSAPGYVKARQQGFDAIITAISEETTKDMALIVTGASVRGIWPRI